MCAATMITIIMIRYVANDTPTLWQGMPRTQAIDVEKGAILDQATAETMFSAAVTGPFLPEASWEHW
jgi:hypothetical protein